MIAVRPMHKAHFGRCRPAYPICRRIAAAPLRTDLLNIGLARPQIEARFPKVQRPGRWL